ncbi:MAG: OmpA family protein [Pirellulaceae bacterium]|jgi:chemotaxis protein MotB
MFRRRYPLGLLAILIVGCNQNPFAATRNGPNWNRGAKQQPDHIVHLDELDRRNRTLDANNRDLHSQLARAEQEKQLLQEQLTVVRRNLKETTNDLKSEVASGKQSRKELEGINASVRFRGGASIRANNSLSNALELADIPDATVTREDGIVRIQLAADDLFRPGTVQWQTPSQDILSDVAAAIRRHYPRQALSIESHTDRSTRRVGETQHQLSVSQALLIHNELVTRHRLPEGQFVVTGFGGMAPLVSNATPEGRHENRRIDIVVHPESIARE